MQEQGGAALCCFEFFGWDTGRQWGCEHRRFGQRRRVGGASARLNSKTDCNKFFPLLGNTKADAEEVVRRLMTWCMRAPEFARQHDHARFDAPTDTRPPAALFFLPESSKRGQCHFVKCHSTLLWTHGQCPLICVHHDRGSASRSCRKFTERLAQGQLRLQAEAKAKVNARPVMLTEKSPSAAGAGAVAAVAAVAEEVQAEESRRQHRQPLRQLLKL